MLKTEWLTKITPFKILDVINIHKYPAHAIGCVKKGVLIKNFPNFNFKYRVKILKIRWLSNLYLTNTIEEILLF